MSVWAITGFAAATVVAVATPGPDVILAMSNGSRFGVQRPIPGMLAVLCSVGRG
jgi:threonine/homoserine/homoserine lactone efflux protein